MIDSVSACGCDSTALRTAVLGRVTRSPASRSSCWRSGAGVTSAVLRPFLNESRIAGGGGLRAGVLRAGGDRGDQALGDAEPRAAHGHRLRQQVLHALAAVEDDQV